MMFELSPFGLVVPEWVITAATVAIWVVLIGIVLGVLMQRRDRPAQG